MTALTTTTYARPPTAYSDAVYWLPYNEHASKRTVFIQRSSVFFGWICFVHVIKAVISDDVRGLGWAVAALICFGISHAIRKQVVKQVDAKIAEDGRPGGGLYQYFNNGTKVVLEMPTKTVETKADGDSWQQQQV